MIGNKRKSFDSKYLLPTRSRCNKSAKWFHLISFASTNELLRVSLRYRCTAEIKESQYRGEESEQDFEEAAKKESEHNEERTRLCCLCLLSAHFQRNIILCWAIRKQRRFYLFLAKHTQAQRRETRKRRNKRKENCEKTRSKGNRRESQNICALNTFPEQQSDVLRRIVFFP